YFRRGCLPFALEELRGKKRCLIVTDRFLFENGHVNDSVRVLKSLGLEVETFFEVSADPTLAVVRKGVALANAFQPDVILALGGGSPMD
ncbi:iron-containing alcohol dehydrogenase, partial [Azospirillum sp. TSH64]